MELLSADWLNMFTLDNPLFELFIRSTVLYFSILIIMRLLPRRTGGELAMMDLIFVLLIAQAAANALGEYNSIIDGLVLILTFVGWNYLLNILSYRFLFIEKLVSDSPLQVVKDGKLLPRNMRKELLTKEEIMAHLREQGIDDLKDVKEAFVEGEGHLTVICYDR